MYCKDPWHLTTAVYAARALSNRKWEGLGSTANGSRCKCQDAAAEYAWRHAMHAAADRAHMAGWADAVGAWGASLGQPSDVPPPLRMLAGRYKEVRTC